MKYLLSIILLFPIFCSAKQIRIAVIDSGYNISNHHLKLCDDGHKDFTSTGYNDTYKHGDNIAHIIADRLKDLDYCIIILKVFDKKTKEEQAGMYSILAFNYARTLNVDIVNYSASGIMYSFIECRAVDYLINSGARFIAAAGNNKNDLDKECSSYPACCTYKVTSVGNMNNTENQCGRHRLSNYGQRITAWEQGTEVFANGSTLSGTSQAAAIHTAKIARELYEKSRSN